MIEARALRRLPGRAIRNLLSRQLAGRGWSDDDLARATGLSRLRVNRLKSRHARPTVRDALLIAAALGLRVAQLFFLTAAPADLDAATDGSDGLRRASVELDDERRQSVKSSNGCANPCDGKALEANE